MAIAWLSLLAFVPAVLLLFVVCVAVCRWLLGGQQAVERRVDWPLIVFVAVVSTAIVIGWTATTMATTGWFSLPLLSLIVVLLSLIPGGYLWRRRKERPAGLAAIGWQEVALVVLLLVAALVYFRPHEYVLGGNDAGSYVNIANQVARTGSIVTVDDWTAFLSKYRDVTLREQPAYWLPRYLQFVGWYVDDANPARIVPQFFPFHPALLAVGAGLVGPVGALFVTPLWGVLDIAALYFLARRLFDKNIALVASAFLAVTATQIFFARYPTTEPLTMLLVFTALLAFQVIWDERAAPWPWGLLGGAALGAALLTRIDLPLVLGLFILGMLVRWWQRRWNRAWTLFAVTLTLFVLQLVWVVWQINWPYFYNTYTAVSSMLRTDAAVLLGIGLGLLLLLCIVTLLRPAALVSRVAQFTTQPALRWALALALVLLSLYAYFLRPVLEPPRQFQSWPENTIGLILNGQNWLRMGWYLTPLGILLATIGLAVIIVRGALPRMTLVLAVGVLTTLQYVYNILNAHYHIYAMRRYVPIVIPMLLMFAAAGALAFPMLKRRWIAYAVRGRCVAGLAIGMLYQARFVLPQQDFAGSLRQLAEFQSKLRPDAVLLLASPAESNFADAFGVPLHMIYGHDVATLRSNAPAGASFLVDLLDKAEASGRTVQLIADGSLPATVRENLFLEPVDSYAYSAQMLMNTYTDFPSALQDIYHGLEVYDVASVVAGEEQPLAEETFIDVGHFDAPFLGAGFYGKEVVPGAPSMRWTNGVAELTAPAGMASSRSATDTVVVQIRAMIYRPEGVEAGPVHVLLDGVAIGEFVPTAEWQIYSIPVTVAQLGLENTTSIKFQTDTFNPAQLQVNDDDRDLGFLLDWLRIVDDRQELNSP